MRPTIASASSGGEVLSVSKVATISPRRITDTRSVRLMISRSLWVMKMIVLRSPLSTLQHLEQLVGLGRRQHRGRLVEHENVRAAHQRFQDLDPLLQADRQFADDGVRIDLEAVFAPELGEPLADQARAFGEQRAALGAEHDVLEHAERRHQHEVLMHHADAVADRLARRADPDRLAVDADFAGVGLVEAVENRHQRRFSGAVLADDAVNDAAFDDEIDVIVGVNRAEALVDADQFDGGRGFVGLSRHPPLLPATSWPGLTRPSTQRGLQAICTLAAARGFQSTAGRREGRGGPGQARP